MNNKNIENIYLYIILDIKNRINLFLSLGYYNKFKFLLI